VESIKSSFNKICSAVSLFVSICASRLGLKGNACKVFVGKPEGKRPLGRPRRRRKDNIKMDLRAVGWGVTD
jgi:hypothetical protein